MIKVKTTTNTTMTIKDCSLTNGNTIVDEDGEIVDIYALIGTHFGDGTGITIKIAHTEEEAE